MCLGAGVLRCSGEYYATRKIPGTFFYSPQKRDCPRYFGCRKIENPMSLSTSTFSAFEETGGVASDILDRFHLDPDKLFTFLSKKNKEEQMPQPKEYRHHDLAGA